MLAAVVTTPPSHDQTERTIQTAHEILTLISHTRKRRKTTLFKVSATAKRSIHVIAIEQRTGPHKVWSPMIAKSPMPPLS